MGFVSLVFAVVRMAAKAFGVLLSRGYQWKRRAPRLRSGADCVRMWSRLAERQVLIAPVAGVLSSCARLQRTKTPVRRI